MADKKLLSYILTCRKQLIYMYNLSDNEISYMYPSIKCYKKSIAEELREDNILFKFIEGCNPSYQMRLIFSFDDRPDRLGKYLESINFLLWILNNSYLTEIITNDIKYNKIANIKFSKMLLFILGRDVYQVIFNMLYQLKFSDNKLDFFYFLSRESQQTLVKKYIDKKN
jgi:hypothetical protein